MLDPKELEKRQSAALAKLDFDAILKAGGTPALKEAIEEAHQVAGTALMEESHKARSATRKLIFGDNLIVMRDLPSNSVHLCCTDPPFNSGRNYNMYLGSQAEQTAFADTWTWDDAAIESREEIQRLSRNHEVYGRLNHYLEGYDVMFQYPVSGWHATTRAYLAFMGPRIVEIYRLLRDDGSFYLHCDATASHYLKGMLDAVFGQKNFRNEIVWGYRTGGISKKYWPRKHDTLLFYVKSSAYKHNAIQDRVYYEKPFFTSNQDEQGRYYADVFIRDVWEDVKPLINVSKERLGYPTQKPRALYERIIKASSNEGDIVLDPFVGCGTTIDAAEALNRQWIGIDLTILALDPMQRRLADRYGFKPSVGYESGGYPKNLQEAMALARENKKHHDFANWAVTRLGLNPTQDSGDGGMDGTSSILVQERASGEGLPRVIAEVKTGETVGVKEVRAFRTAMSNVNAMIGIFITLAREPTASMRAEQEFAGYIEHNGKRYNRLQFWSIDNTFFDNPDTINHLVNLPWPIKPQNKSDRHYDGQQQEITLDN